jgi:competence protein ComEA
VTAASSAAGAPGGRVDVNTAGAAELERLPGIGPALAQRIVEWRAANGPFRAVEDLQRVPGIGAAKLERLRPVVSVSP